MRSAGSLADTVDRLRGPEGELGLEIEPAGEGWHAWPDVSERLQEWYAAERTSEHGPVPAGPAAASLGAALGWAVTGFASAAIVREQRCPDVSPSNLLVHRSGEGWIDRIGVRAPVVAVLPGDPAAGHRDAVVLAGPEELRRWFAERAVASLEPVLAGVRALGPIGPPALWGSVADSIALEGVWAVCGEDESAERAAPAWEVSLAIVEAVAARAPRMRTRPRPVAVETPGGAVLRALRGTCCLYYRTPESHALHDGEDRKCSNCPLRDPGDQVAAWQRELADPSPGLPG